MPSQTKSLYQKAVSKIHDFNFNYPERRDLNPHESHINPDLLFGIRLVAFIYLTGVYIWSLTQMGSLTINIIFLTMLGYFSTWMYFGLLLQDHLFSKISKKIPFLHKFIQIIFQLSLCAEVPITIVFWTVLLPIVLDMPDISTETIVIQANLHAVPLVFLTLDLAFNVFSFPIRHISILICYMIIYLIINLSYSLSVKPVYKPINWADLKSYILSLGCLISTLLVHFLSRVLYRRWKSSKLHQKDEQKKTLLMHIERQNSDITVERALSDNATFKKSVQL